MLITSVWLATVIPLAACLVITLPIGKWVIEQLRRMKAGQEIREDGPSWHASKAGTPTMGGVMFIIGTGLTLLVLGWPRMLAGDFAHLYVFLFALCFGMIGLVDDYRKVKEHRNLGLTAKQKFLLQLGASVIFLLLMGYVGLLHNQIYVPFLKISFGINWLLYVLFAAFIIVGTVNAVNLTDGIDGLAGSVTLVVMIFFMITCVGWKMLSLSLFAAALAGGLGAFLFYNRHPAKVFMGDTGSLFLGGAVAAMAFAADMPLILIPVGIIYIIETLSVILQVGYFKATHGKRLFKMAPFHHHLEKCGWSENKLVAVFSGVTAVCSLLAWLGV